MALREKGQSQAHRRGPGGILQITVEVGKIRTYYFRHKGFKDILIEVEGETTKQAFSKLKAVIAHPESWLLIYIWVNCFYPHVKTLICIEPIMDFSKDFAEKIKKVKPWAVVFGYDNYNMGLPEPKLSKVLALISEIEKYSTVYKKTLRGS